ncbi:MAG: LuxR family transcriptional regulator, partial [Moorea sp. SIO3C2]|nr:LuxR family transcriptional regulator [Moorena sp. SIO3C2]
SQINSISDPIWRVCQALIDRPKNFDNRKLIIESEIQVDKSIKFRVRVRWLKLEVSQEPYLLVTIEEEHQSSKKNVINAPIKYYYLTDREREVLLLKQANFTHREIAEKLFISINTVKKHLKNIYATQKAARSLRQRGRRNKLKSRLSKQGKRILN